MESRNPVLRRFTEQEESGQAGFAYDEGRSAYAAAAGAEAATAPTAEQLQGIYDTPGPGTGRLTLDDVIVKTDMLTGKYERRYRRPAVVTASGTAPDAASDRPQA